jgi:hypothetical protein
MDPKTRDSNQAVANKDGGRLELSIVMAQSVYSGADPIICTLSVSNVGEHGTLINARMLVNLPFFENEISFAIHDRRGHRYAYQYIVVPRPVDADDFIELAPGEDWTRDYDLRDLFGIRPGQSFTAQAFYQNRFAHPNRRLEAWIGKVSSNLVEFITA